MHAPAPPAHPSGKHCIVIGAGIIGAAIAWYLTQAGARVTVLEAAQAGGLATRDSWAWINASWGNPEPYVRLRLRAMQEWQRLQAEVPGVGLRTCGGLLWDLPDAQLDAYATEHGTWGYALQRLDAPAMAALEPALRQPPARALLAPQEGMVEPVAAARALLDAAITRGAVLRTGCPVLGLLEHSGRITGVRVEGAVLVADEVVVAAGCASASLLDGLGLAPRMEAVAGLLVHTRPTTPLLRHLLMAPGLHVRQTREGRLVAGADYVGSTGGEDPAQQAQTLMQRLRTLLAGTDGLELDFTTLGERPTPADGFPLVGRPRQTPGLYLAVTHSGVTLAPAVGLFAARELLQGERDALLAPYAPDRLIPA